MQGYLFANPTHLKLMYHRNTAADLGNHTIVHIQQMAYTFLIDSQQLNDNSLADNSDQSIN